MRFAPPIGILKGLNNKPMSSENPTNSREVFDENEAGIAQKKQELTDAVAAGDYGKVAELAQEAKSMEATKGEMIDNAHDEASGIEKEKREAALAEQARQEQETSQKEAAELLEKMKGGNDSAEGLQNETGSAEKLERANQLLKELFVDGKRGSLDPFGNIVSKQQMAKVEEFRSIRSELDQSTLAQKFFDDTIGQNILNNKGAYMVYKLFKGSEFSDKFKELENARLEAAGYGEFNL